MPGIGIMFCSFQVDCQTTLTPTLSLREREIVGPTLSLMARVIVGPILSLGEREIRGELSSGKRERQLELCV
jgi:hypothetical protein